MREIDKFLDKIICGDTLEVLKQMPSDSVDCIITSPPYWCYAEGHEVLTSEGWKDIAKVSVGDKVLSVNPENMELEWVKVVEVNKWPYKGKMIEFKSTHIDLLVTPNHKMFVYDKQIGKAVKPRGMVGYFQSTKDKKGVFFVEAKDVKDGYITPKTGFKWKGKEPQYFILPPLKTVYNKQERYYPPLKIKIEDWVAFLGIWIAEGSVRGSKGGKKKAYSISIKQKELKASKIGELLKRLPFDFKEIKMGDLVVFEISNKQLWHYLKKLGNSHTKYIPKEIKELSPRLLKIFIEWYLMGDGCIKRKGTTHEEISCYTVSERLKGDLQEIALKIGSNISVQGKNKLIFLRRKTVKLKETMKNVSYDKMIYGVQVEKNHTLCIRRNNKIVFSGNSLRDYGEATWKVWGGDPNCEHEWDYHKGRKYSGGTNNTFGQYRDGRTHFIQRYAFCKKCGAWYGQLGLEPTLDMYIEHLLEITAELKRILKPTGVLWWNHGDNYATKSGSGKIYENIDQGYEEQAGSAGLRSDDLIENQGIPRKSLCMQNYRLILRMVDEQGWILRNIIIWYKPNHMPSSAKDRFTNSYEPVFMLTKSKKYWFDLDAVRVPYSESGKERRRYLSSKFGSNPNNPLGKLSKGIKAGSEPILLPEEPHPLGKNPGDLWEIPTEAFPDAHFATFPQKLVEPMIKASCPQWICKKCGKARERIVERKVLEFKAKPYNANTEFIHHGEGKSTLNNSPVIRKSIGWTDCGCGAGWDSGIVLDPFAGSGTTCLVAKKLGRHYIGIELNPEYVKMARRRVGYTQRLDKFGLEFK